MADPFLTYVLDLRIDYSIRLKQRFPLNLKIGIIASEWLLCESTSFPFTRKVMLPHQPSDPTIYWKLLIGVKDYNNFGHFTNVTNVLQLEFLIYTEIKFPMREIGDFKGRTLERG
jgi:hypothetical protein